jgi:hypothetical protein
MTQSRSSQTSVMEFSLDDVFGEELKPNVAVKPRPQNDASHLMDEIFGEVEQVLDGSLIPPDEPVRLMMPTDSNGGIKFDIAAALSERYPQLTMPSNQVNTDRTGIDLELPDLPAPATALSKPGERRAPNQSKPQTSLSLFERMMIFTGCASAIAALAVWIVSQGILPKSIIALGEKLQATSAIVPNGTPEAAVSGIDVKFSEYMLRSLAAIDRDTASKPPVQPLATLPAPVGSTIGTPIATSANSLPKPNGPMALLPASPNLPGMPGNVMPATTSNLPAPVLPVQSPPDSVSRRELNQVMNRIVGMLERIAPGVSNRLQLPGGKAPVVVAAKPAPTTMSAKAPSRAALKVSEAPAPPVNLPQRTLTGVIEMGDRSAVLFELNGVTQRVYVGESIGSTGWNLVEVAKDAAVFRRNGEVRTVGIGQKL